MNPGNGMIRMRPMACLLLALAALGCRPMEGGRSAAPAAQNEPERRETQPAHILGQIQLRGESDAGGIQIYIPGTSMLAITGRDGRFDLAGAPQGRHEVWARADGYQPVTLGEVDVDPDSGRQNYNISPVTLDFRPEEGPAGVGKPQGLQAEPGSIKGQLVPGPGEDPPPSWAGATIELEKTPYRTVAGADGTFLLWSLPPDRYQLTARLDGYLTTTTAVRVLPGTPATTVTIALASEAGPDTGSYIALRTYPAETVGAGRGGVMGAAAVTSATTATGSVRGIARYNRNGVQDHSGISISLTGSSQAASTAEDGAYALENVKAGRYQLLAQAEGYEPARVPVEVAAGETLELDEILLELRLDYPRVINAMPAPGTRDVTIQRDMPFMFRFSKKMNPQSVKQAIRIEPEAAWQALTGREAPDTDYDVLKIVIYGARAPMARYDTPYRITISQGATDVEGLAMQEPFTLNFRTGRAAIYRTEPVDGTSGAAMSPMTPVLVYFNAILDRRTVLPEVVSITPRLETTPVVALRDSPDTGWTTMVIQARWRPDTAYRVTVERSIRTIGNTPIANAPYHFRFKTARMTLPRLPSPPKAGR